MSRVLLANLAALGASLSAGVSVVATRFVVGETVPVTLAFYRYVIAALCLAPLLPFVWPRHRLALAEIVKIAMLGTLFFGFFTWAFSAALQYTTAARGAIGLATIPIQTLIVAAIFGREQLTAFKVLSVGLAFAGIAVVFGPEAYNAEMSNYAIGDSLMLLGALSAAIYSAFGRPVLGRHGPLFVMTLAMVFGVLALAPLAAANGALAGMPQFSPKGWLALLFLGTIGGALQFTLYTWALRWLSPSRVAIYLTLNPITAMALGNP
jgi:drug/metabolite transporter (DMT)-like permease